MLGSVVGVDIGTSAVRAVSATPSRRGRPKITRIGEIGLPSGALVNGELRDPEIVAQAMKRLWSKSHFSSRAVAIGIGNQQTLVRRADLITDDMKHIKSVLDEQLEGSLAVETDQLVLDGYPMGEFVSSAGDIKVDAFVVGALAAASENLYATTRKARLRPMRLDHSGFALIRASVNTFGDPHKVPGAASDETEHYCEVIADIGAQTIVVSIHNHGRPALIRVIPGGGESITRALMDQLGLTFEQADYVKSMLGIAPVAADGHEGGVGALKAVGLDTATISMAQNIINLMASSLLQGIRETVEFYLASDPHVAGVLRVVLAGGGSQLPGISQRIAAELRTDVGFLTPLSSLAKSKSSAARWRSLDPRFSLAFGLALGVK